MMFKLWQRYCLKETFQVFALVLFSVYFLYFLIDYSAHTKSFHEVPFEKILLYYLYQFARLSDLLFPCALLLATIKVTTTLSGQNELLALVTAGLSLKRVTLPFLVMALAATSFLYLNFQFFQPYFLPQIAQFENHYFKNTKEKKHQVQFLRLADHSSLFYREYDVEVERFTDLFWVKDQNEIYYMKYLFPFEAVARGQSVHALIKKEGGEFTREAFYAEHTFPELLIESASLVFSRRCVEWQSLVELARNLAASRTHFCFSKVKDNEAHMWTLFFYKMCMPLTCFLVVIALVPFCLRFSRTSPLFFYYAIALFGLITFFTLVNSCVILGENQVLPAFWAMIPLPAFVFFFFGWRYAKV